MHLYQICSRNQVTGEGEVSELVSDYMYYSLSFSLINFVFKRNHIFTLFISL